MDMEKELQELLKENNELIKESLELSRENAKKIKKIHAYMRRTFIAKVMYWIFLVLITAGALYAVRPYIEKIIESYNAIQDKVEMTTNFIENPSSVFKDLDILNQLLQKNN